MSIIWDRIAVFAATSVEYQALRAALTDWSPQIVVGSTLQAGIGRYANTTVELFCTAMGPQNAAHQAKLALAQSQAKIVIISGLAGGLVADSAGKVVLYQGCYTTEVGQRLACSEHLLEILAQRFTHHGVSYLKGEGVTMPKVACKVAEKQLLAERYQAVAVDMESYQILAVAQQHGCQAVVVRVVSDDTNTDLPNLNAAMDEQMAVSNFKMMLEFAAHPILAKRFLVNLRQALQQLRQVLAYMLDSRTQDV